jgi:WD40 repeat protein
MGALASGSHDKTVKLWDAHSRTLLHTLAAGDAGRLQFWDVDCGETFIYLYAFGPAHTSHSYPTAAPTAHLKRCVTSATPSETR